MHFHVQFFKSKNTKGLGKMNPIFDSHGPDDLQKFALNKKFLQSNFWIYKPSVNLIELVTLVNKYLKITVFYWTHLLHNEV